MNEEWYSCDGQGNWSGASSRRAFAGLALGSLVWWAAGSALGQVSLQRPAQHGNVLVVVFLRGGWDALNVVAPYGEDNYYRLRPTLGLAKPTAGVGTKLRDLDGFFGLNPALSGLFPAWDDGDLAIIHAVGSQDRSHSHFEAMATMERGLRDQNDSTGGGWLGRHLKLTGGTGWPMRAVSWGETVPESLGGATGAIGVSSISDYSLRTQSHLESLEALYSRYSDPVSQAGQNTLEVLKTLSKLDPKDYKPSGGASYPDSRLGRALRESAFLIKKEIGLEVACMDSTGWDSHVTQGTTDGWLWTLLKDLGDGLEAFRKDLGKEMSRVTVVVQSEFGRRVFENSGLGTDHGSGGAMFLMGGGVQAGKVMGDWPGLAPHQVVDPGDLRITTDYRDVLAEVLEKRLGNREVNKVFPGRAGKKLNLVI